MAFGPFIARATFGADSCGHRLRHRRSDLGTRSIHRSPQRARDLGSYRSVAVAALGMTLIIILGGIDLSAGTASVLCATVLACCLNADFYVWVSVLFALATGAACGLGNGVLIGLLRIPPSS